MSVSRLKISSLSVCLDHSNHEIDADEDDDVHAGEDGSDEGANGGKDDSGEGAHAGEDDSDEGGHGVEDDSNEGGKDLGDDDTVHPQLATSFASTVAYSALEVSTVQCPSLYYQTDNP